MTKFMYLLKTNVGKIKITEISASDKLEELRREEESCFDLSFDTISAYKDHAAMMHYSATEESDCELKPEGMLLVDSGGQYFTGTTDITRTYILGDITEEEKLHYTSTLRGMLRLSKAKFLYGCRGINLDIFTTKGISIPKFGVIEGSAVAKLKSTYPTMAKEIVASFLQSLAKNIIIPVQSRLFDKISNMLQVFILISSIILQATKVVVYTNACIKNKLRNRENRISKSLFLVDNILLKVFDFFKPSKSLQIIAPFIYIM